MHSLAVTRRRHHRQHGAVIVTVALVLLFLLGFMGIALDFGRLFIVKTELQTAMDSCALAAAQELDGASDVVTRATNAGKTAGNLNKVYFQQTSAGINDENIVFSETLTGTYSRFIAPVNAKYVKCTHTRSGITPWLLQAMGAFSGNGDYAKTQSVGALAVAAIIPSQSSCLIPVGICRKSAANPLGFARGEWVQGVTNDEEEVLSSGQFRWLDFSANGGGTRELKDLLTGQGQCGLPGVATKVEDVGKSGKSNGAVAAWNTRFGIYQGAYDATNSTPDLTGYAWYENGDTVAESMKGRYDAATTGFLAHRGNNDPYQGNNKAPDTQGLKTQGNASNQATHQAGANRRVVVSPVIDCATMEIKALGCFLMLHPLEKNASGKNSKMWMEFISDATSPTNNPCATAGLPGGTSGVRVPALIQ